jgi:O-methyltransferase
VDSKAIPKVLLARLGSRCGARLVYNLNGAFNYLHAGWWLHEHGFRPGVRVASRYDVFERIAAEIRDRRVLYLEFGVAEGSSITRWSHLLRNPGSRLHGFDSFLGLPHDWTLEGHPRGFFSTHGRPPDVSDPRIQFFVGWFDETLPEYRWPEHEVLVVMMDADLYSSTSTVLSHVKVRLLPGSYLYFDQFHHRCDELRAFAELLDETRLHFQLEVASRDLSSVAFKCVR